MNIHRRPWLRNLLSPSAVALLISLSAATQAHADASRHFADDTKFVLVFDLEKLGKAPELKEIFGGKTLLDGFAAFEAAMKEGGSKLSTSFEWLILPSTRKVSHSSNTFLFGVRLAVFEGDYDAGDLRKSADKYAAAQSLEVTAEKVGDHELVRVGKTVYVVLDKHTLLLSESLPPDSREPAFLEPEPGAAEKVLKQAVARFKSSESPKLDERVRSVLAGLEQDKPICWLMVDESVAHRGAIHLADGKALLTAHFDFPSVEKAEEFELQAQKGVREAAMNITKELGDVPFINDVRDARVTRNETRVTLTGSTLVTTAKATIEAIKEIRRLKNNQQ